MGTGVEAGAREQAERGKIEDGRARSISSGAGAMHGAATYNAQILEQQPPRAAAAALWQHKSAWPLAVDGGGIAAHTLALALRTAVQRASLARSETAHHRPCSVR